MKRILLLVIGSVLSCIQSAVVSLTQPALNEINYQLKQDTLVKREKQKTEKELARMGVDFKRWELGGEIKKA